MTAAPPAEPAADPDAELAFAETITWFAIHAKTTVPEAATLARAELAAQRAGYTVSWAHPWTCTLFDPADLDKYLACTGPMYLDGSPITDPAARQAERRLFEKAGLDQPGSFGPVPGATLNGYALQWDEMSICLLHEPGGAVAAESDGLRFDPGTDPGATPRGRLIAAELAADAGLLA